MQAIAFPSAYDNEAAHRQIKLLMKQGKQLSIRIEDEAWISCQGVTGLRYQLEKRSARDPRSPVPLTPAGQKSLTL